MAIKKKTVGKKPSPRAAINAAAAALKKGTPGAMARLNKAVTAFAARSCKAKKAAVSGVKKKRKTVKRKKK